VLIRHCYAFIMPLYSMLDSTIVLISCYDISFLFYTLLVIYLFHIYPSSCCQNLAKAKLKGSKHVVKKVARTGVSFTVNVLKSDLPVSFLPPTMYVCTCIAYSVIVFVRAAFCSPASFIEFILPLLTFKLYSYYLLRLSKLSSSPPGGNL
jgi:hypothetical protein